MHKSAAATTSNLPEKWNYYTRGQVEFKNVSLMMYEKHNLVLHSEHGHHMREFFKIPASEKKNKKIRKRIVT